MRMNKLAKIVRISLFVFATNLVCAKNLTPYEFDIYFNSVVYSFTTANQRIAREVGSIDDEFSSTCLNETLHYVADIYRQIMEYITLRMETYPNVPSGNYVAYFYQKGKAQYNKCVPKLKRERKMQAEQARQAKIQQEKIRNDFIKKMEKEGKKVVGFGDNQEDYFENRLIYKEYYENDEKIREHFDKESGTELKSKERFYPNGLLKWEEVYLDGKINEKYIYDSNGKLVKKYEYNFNGKLLEKYYDSNEKAVEGYEYDSGGKLSKKYFYLDGVNGDIVHKVIYE